MAANLNCPHKEKKCTVCGGCKIRKCCVCEGAPKKRSYKRKINSDFANNLETTTDAFEVSSHVPVINSSSESSDLPRCGHRKRAKCQHNLCDRCCGCGRTTTPQRPLLVRAAKRKPNYVDHESSVFQEACRLTLSYATCTTAKETVSVLSDSCSLHRLRNETCNKIKRSVSEIMEQVINNIAPGDPVGLYMMVSPELDRRFDVNNNDIPDPTLLERLVGLAASIVATLPRTSAESKTVLALFAMCGTRALNRLQNKVSELKQEESEGNVSVDIIDQGFSMNAETTSIESQMTSTNEKTVTRKGANEDFIRKHRRNYVKILFGFQFHEQLE
jgi:hypothetical protein